MATDRGARTEPTAFEYQRADSWDEAAELLRIWEGEAKILAGGQSLVPMLNLRLTMPAALIDINDIGDEGGPRLETSTEGQVVVIPALTRHSTVLASSVIAEHCPMLRAAVGLVGNVRVRNRGTFGGSVAHADPTGEIPCCVLAMGGTITLQGPLGTRTVPASEWFRTYLTTAAEPDELVTEVRIPSAAGAAWAFEEEVRRFSDFATVSVALQARPGRIPSIVLGGVADRPVLVTADVVGPLRNQERTTVTAVADLAARSTEPESDVHASAEHRRRLVRVLVRRALVRALGLDDGNGAPS
ncbi:FAD binding domain-containing protein [Nocardioides sp. LHG3406-4]|uniref:FAD binding domain-containing protein n=1 Tax=Nocardioides sp. LHG3406-4 TaxID=2804575 RepID=UPI003CF70B37